MKMTLAHSIRSGFIVGILAGAALTAVSVLIRLVLPVPTAAELVWDFVAGKIPGPLFSAALDILKFAAKPLFLIGLTLAQLVIGGVLGSIYAGVTGSRLFLFNYSRRTPWLPGAVYGILLWTIIMAARTTILTPGSRYAWLGILVGMLAFGVLQAQFLALFDPAPAPEGAKPVDRARRALLVKGLIGLVVLSTVGVLVKVLLAAAQGLDEVTKSRLPRLSTYITPTDDFYRVSKNLSDPVVKAEIWQLEVKGLVANPLTLTLDDLRSLPSVTQAITLECISNEVGGDLMGNAVWRGVPLRDLLSTAGVMPQAVDLALHAADAYSDSITIARAMAPGNLIAYEMNGEPLTTEHGFPARLLVPGIYGMKNVKWLTKIEPVASDFQGFWQAQGWSDTAAVLTTSRIDTPDRWEIVGSQVAVAGVAFAGDRGISRVEVSFDGGISWQEARLDKTESPYSWVLWLLDWQFNAAGPQPITVRAIDGQGSPQEAKVEPPFPDGASGYHKITVTVRP